MGKLSNPDHRGRGVEFDEGRSEGGRDEEPNARPTRAALGHSRRGLSRVLSSAAASTLARAEGAGPGRIRDALERDPARRGHRESHPASGTMGALASSTPRWASRGGPDRRNSESRWARHTAAGPGTAGGPLSVPPVVDSYTPGRPRRQRPSRMVPCSQRSPPARLATFGHRAPQAADFARGDQQEDAGLRSRRARDDTQTALTPSRGEWPAGAKVLLQTARLDAGQDLTAENARAGWEAGHHQPGADRDVDQADPQRSSNLRTRSRAAKEIGRLEAIQNRISNVK